MTPLAPRRPPRPRRVVRVGLRAGLSTVLLAGAPLLVPLTSGYAKPTGVSGVSGGSTVSGVPAVSGVSPSTAGAVRPAATPADASVLTLGTVTPLVAGPSSTVILTGTVTARTAALSAPTVRVVLGSAPIVSRGSVTAWATSSAALTGPELVSATVSGPVAPGASAPFSLTIPAGRLSSSHSFAAIPVALQVRDTASGTNEILRTFVGWQRTKQYEALHVAIVAPVTLSPDAALFSADPLTRTAAWRTELDPSSRINRILDGTDASGPAGPVPVTWAVDPAVLGPATTGASGSTATTTTSATSGTTDGPGDPLTPIVAPLATRLATGVGRHTLWALPASDPDLAATAVIRPDNPTVARMVADSATLGTALGVPVTTGVAWPTDGSLAADREPGLRAAYQSTGLAALLGSVSSLPLVPGYSGQAPRRTASGIPLLAWDDELSTLATQTTAATQGTVTGQRFLAETAALLGESPGIPRSFLVALPRTADPDPVALRQLLGTMAQTPWIQLVTTGDLQQQAAAQDPVATTTAGSWTAGGPAQVDGAALTRIADQRASVAEISTVLGVNGPAYRAQWTAVLDQLTSVRWRQNPSQLAALTQSIGDGTAAATSGISVSDQTTNFLADEGTLQVTVVNALAVPVEGLHLVLSPENPRLRIVAQPEAVTIGAGSRAVIRVRAQALAAGLVPVTATLTSGDGTPVGVPGIITVRANPPGNGFYVVGGSVIAVLLLVGIIRTLRRPRRREPEPTLGAAATDPADGGDDPSGTPSGPDTRAAAAVAAPSVGGETPVG